MRGLSALICILAVCLALPAEAWNATGHRVIAAIAYDRLTPGTRARVDELIRRHPDYPRFITPAASVRAGQIRSDPRFYDESGSAAAPTPLLAGFPSMARHAAWHHFHCPSRRRNSATGTGAPDALSEMKGCSANRRSGGQHAGSLLCPGLVGASDRRISMNLCIAPVGF